MSPSQQRPQKSTNLSKEALASPGLSACADKWLGYKLKDNKSNASPGTICFFDTETWYNKDTAYETGQYQRLRLGVAIAGRLEGGKWTREKRIRFTTADEFWTFIAELQDPKRPVWLFAHNIGFDLTIVKFPELLLKGDYVIEDPTKEVRKTDILGNKQRKTSGFLCTDDPPVIVSCHSREGRKLICVDSFNYFVGSLASIGKTIGRDKTEMPLSETDVEGLYRYCENDVQIVKDAILGLIGWVKSNNLGKFRFTAPSQAMAAFRHRWNKPAIVCHNQNHVRKLERESYYGGRLECFYIGPVTGDIYELDVASLYPSVMKSELYPAKLLEFNTPATHSDRRETTLGLDTVATVLLKTQEGFPKRQSSLGTFYPTGVYWTTLAGPELLYASQSNLILEVKSWAKYELREIFTGFVDWFWSYRQEQTAKGNTLNANLAKLLMNGLYGKFGQMTSAWENRPDVPDTGKIGIYLDETFANGGSHVFRNLGNMRQQFTGKGEHPNAFPAIAAYVTSYGREWMRLLRNVAGLTNVFYMVTDSLFTNHAGYTNLVNSGLVADNEIGMLRVKTRATIGQFDCIHHYSVGSHSVHGSRKKSARLNPDGSTTEIQFESFEKILMRKPDGSVHVKPVTKRFSKEYKRGTIQPDGWVQPLVLNERE